MKIIGYVLSGAALTVMALVGGLCSSTALAKEFERFDAQYYNGQFYPLVDNIEWGEQDKELNHMEFHFHSKDKPMDIAVVPGEKGGRPVLWMMYDLKFRNGERICRHVLAPSHFKKGMKLYTYRDNSDPDYDNIYVYSEPPKKLKGANKQPVPEYQMPPYERCSDENASNMPYEPGESPAKVAEEPKPAAPAKGEEKAAAPAREPASGQGQPAKLPIDYDNTAVPFSF